MLVKQAIYRHMSVPVLEKALDAYALRDKTHANNLANLNTPGYKRMEVKFEKMLKDLLDTRLLEGNRTQEGHLRVGRPETTELAPEGFIPKDPTLPGEVNNVDIDLEASALAENQIAFHFAATFVKSELETLTASVRGRLL